MQKIDGVNYPDDVQGVLDDDKLGPMFRAYLKKKGTEASYLFLDAANKKQDPKAHFKQFFADGAKCEVNVESKLLLAAKRLGKAQDWKSKEWKGIYEAAVAKTRSVIDLQYLDSFFTSDAFKEHHFYTIEKDMLRKNYPALLKDLNTADKKAVANVAALLKADKKKAPRAVKALVKKNKIAEKPPGVIKKIKKAFKIK
ncbi:hypothetical protein [uncultured Tateyamaria sp.]|uniref:hypothetical protein n=1 Tax=uncultured Tateyamaria sp. TaxID=455651 RepID=UPI002639E6EF|nr:hypothetical protein [uncultured Tateyamaria sp.]